MKHYSEHTLELYVRNSEQIARERTAIELHVLQCAGCSAIVNDLKAFYTLAESDTKLLSVSNETEDALVVQPQYIRTRPLTQIQMPNSLPQRLLHLVRKRPITSGVSGVTILMLFIFGIQTYRSSSDDNPSYYRFNETENTLEIFGNNDRLLWDVPVGDAKTLNQEKGIYPKIVFDDINSDGKNEIVTILPVGQYIDSQSVLQVFDSKKQLLLNREFFYEPQIKFRQIEYLRSFCAIGVKTLKIQNQRNIFITSNNGRSPSILVRLDKDGNIVGRYWHFGHLTNISSVDIDSDGDEELILLGMNDVPYPGITFGAIIVLDPDKITGDTESSATLGFGFPKTTCEEYYIKIPRSDVDSILAQPAVPFIIEKSDNVVRIIVRSGEGTIPTGRFEYSFTPSMKILAVKGDDPGARYYEKMKAEGKVISTYGYAYFDQLKKGVRYWNGKQWLEEPTQVFRENNNPHKYVINTETNTIEVFNAENTNLWNLILVNNFHTLHGNKDEYFNEYVRIKDLDGDGVNEVITTLCTEHNQHNNAPAVQVFNHNGTLRYRKELGKEITYGSFQYPNAFTTKGLIVDDFDGDGKSEIYIGLTHRNSPYSLVKLDYLGNETGRYWTYGHAFGIDTLLIQGKTYVALMGIDDTQEERKALLTILKPNEIRGEKRGTLFKGYNFSSSNAEEYVVNFPRTELEGALGVPKPRVTQIIYQNSEEFAICIGIPYKEQIFGIADVHFSSTLAVKNILFIDGALTMHELLRKQGKITAEWNNAYREALKKQIRYWDGRTWNGFPKKGRFFVIK